MSAIQIMEEKGLVHRVRNEKDRRKMNVHLTEKGRALEAQLLPQAATVVDTAVKGFSEREVSLLLELLRGIQTNLAAEPEPQEEVPF